MQMKLFAKKILELSKFRTFPKIIVKHHSKLQNFVIRKCPNLKKVPPREAPKIPVVQVTRKV